MIGRLLCGLLLLVVSIAARADVYGYVDPDGTLHLATEQLDPRYALFLRSGDGNGPIKVVTSKESLPAAPTAADPALTRTRLFQRLVGNPDTIRYEPLIVAAAKRHDLDPRLVKAVIAVESGFSSSAVSDKGAIGLMQVLPATGERYGVRADAKKSIEAKLADPALNLEIGTRYLSDLRRMFVDRLDLALAAYNAGENAVIRFRNAIPPFPETQAYVRLVEQFHVFYGPAPDPHARGRDLAQNDRIHVVIPARRNLPDPNVPLRLPAPVVDADEAASVVVPAPTGSAVVPSS